MANSTIAQLFAGARRALPNECCGWLTGSQGGPPNTIHWVPAQTRDSFAFDCPTLLRFARSFDSSAPPRLLFHSHPGGSAALSHRDISSWAPTGTPLYPIPWLILGMATSEAVRYEFRNGVPVTTGRWREVPSTAADVACVTLSQ